MSAKENVEKSFRSWKFLVLLIGLSMICAVTAFNFITALLEFNLFSMVISAIFLVTPILSAICGWKLYLGNVSKENIKSVSAHFAFGRVLAIILAVCIGICGIGLIVAAALVLKVGPVIFAVEEGVDYHIGHLVIAGIIETMQRIGMGLITIIILIVTGISMALTINFVVALGSLRSFFVRLSDSYPEAEYDHTKSPSLVSIWICFVCCIILSVWNVSMIAFVGLALDLLFSAIWINALNTKVANNGPDNDDLDKRTDNTEILSFDESN